MSGSTTLPGTSKKAREKEEQPPPSRQPPCNVILLNDDDHSYEYVIGMLRKLFGYPPEKASDRKLVARIAKEIQYQIQKDLNDLLRERKSMFAEWDGDF